MIQAEEAMRILNLHRGDAVVVTNFMTSVLWAKVSDCEDLDLRAGFAGAMGKASSLGLGLALARPDRRVMVLDGDGHYTRAGSEVRLYDAGSKELMGMNILDTGSGYNSQNAMPVHFGLRNVALVDVEITVFTRGGRKSIWLRNVDPKTFRGRHLTVKINRVGKLVD